MVPDWTRMKFFECVWKRNGEEIFRLLMHATDEADFMAKAKALLAARPISDNLENTTVEIGFGDTAPPPYVPPGKDAS